MKTKKPYAALCCVLLAWTPCAASAEPHPAGLDEVKALALEHSPELESQRALIESEIATLHDLSKPHNPSLTASMEFPRQYPNERGDNEWSIGISQPLRLSDFGARRALHVLQRRERDKEKAVELLKVFQKITLLYYRLWALQQEQKHLGRLAHRAKDLSKLVDVFAEQGRVGEKDRAITVAAEARVSAEQQGIQFDIESVIRKISALVGRNLSGMVVTKPEYPPLLSLDALKELARHNESSVMERSKLLFEIAEEQERVARLDSFPEFTPQVQFLHNDEGKDFIGVGFSVELPLFQSNRSRRIQSKATRHVASKKLQYLTGGGFDGELESLHRQILTKQAQARVYDGRVVPSLGTALKLANQQFANGQTSIFEVWQLEKEHHDAIDTGVSLWIESFAARSELEILIGESLEEK